MWNSWRANLKKRTWSYFTRIRARLIPLQSPELIQVYVAAAEYGHNLRSRGRLDQAMQQRGHRRCGGAFHHQLAVRHDPDHRVEDFFVRQGDDVIHKALHDRERVLAYALHAQAVNDAVDFIERHQVSGFDAALHGRAIG